MNAAHTPGPAQKALIRKIRSEISMLIVVIDRLNDQQDDESLELRAACRARLDVLNVARAALAAATNGSNT
jgi:hypothetical protein